MAETKRTFEETKAAYVGQYPDSPFFETWFPREKFLAAEYDSHGNFSISREDDGIYGVALGTAPRVPSEWKNFSIDSRRVTSIPEEFNSVAEWDCYWAPTRSSQSVEVGEATDLEIKELRRTASIAATLEDKPTHQKHQRTLEAKRTQLRRELFTRQDEIEAQRNDLIQGLEALLGQRVVEQTLFVVAWSLG